MKINIGATANGARVAFDLETLIVTRLLLTANSGAGKSWALRRLMEQLFGHVQVIAIDPEGEFSTLREKFGFVLIGPGGEAAADVRSAAMVAEKLLELRASAVCDLYELKAAQRHAWVKNFLEAMVNAPKKLWHPVVVVVDEAHQFCPEPKAGKSEARDAMVDLVTKGRKRGFCPVFATQRLAKLDKDASAELLNRLVGGTFEDVDVKRALDLLSIAPEEKRQFALKLRSMSPGTFFAFGRAIARERVEFKVAPVETSHPQSGSAKHAAEPPPPPEKIRELLPKLADLPKEAADRAQTVDDLKRRIAELTREVSVARKAQPIASPKTVSIIDQAATDRAVQKATAPLKRLLEDAMKIIVKVAALGFDDTPFNPEQIEAVFKTASKDIARVVNKHLDLRAEQLKALKSEASRLKARVDELISQADESANVTVEIERKRFSSSPSRVPMMKKGGRGESPEPERGAVTRRPASESNGNVSGSQGRILAALAMFESIGRPTVDKKWIAALAGASHTSSSYTNNLGALRTAGYIDYPQPGTAALTAEGRAVAPTIDTPDNPEDLLKRCKEIVTRPQAAILEVLFTVYPNALDKGELADQVGASPTSSSYTNNLGALRSAGMIDYPEQGKAKAAGWLFLEGA